MSFHFKDFIRGIWRREQFCCCLPVRFGVICMSTVGIAITGVLTIALWHEVASNMMTAHANSVLIVAGVVETLLCLVSILGLAGAIARKQLFIAMYTYFLYGHFLLNVGVAGYLFWMITHAEQSDVVKACKEAITNSQAQAQCTGLLEITKTIFLAVGFTVLFTELYGALIATRYLLQLKGQKREMRNSRMLARRSRQSGYASLASLDSGSSPYNKEFNPYATYEGNASSSLSTRYVELSDETKVPPAYADEEAGYGGGRWSHEQLQQYEKSASPDLPEPAVPSSDPRGQPTIAAPVARPATTFSPEALYYSTAQSPDHTQSTKSSHGSRVSFLPSPPGSRHTPTGS